MSTSPPGARAYPLPGSPTGAPAQARQALLQLAAHELRTLGRLHHDGLVPIRDVVDCELGVGLAYPYDESWQRLDLWLAAQTQGVPLSTQLSIVRQVGETLQYAHANRVVHRTLPPAPCGCGRCPAPRVTSRSESVTGGRPAPSTPPRP